MAQYKTHTFFNLIIGLPLSLFALWYFFHFKEKEIAVYSLSFCYASLFMNPDMDLAHKIRLFSLRGLLSLPFRLYSRIFSHRGLSHSVLFGTLTRVLWLFLAALAVAYIFEISFLKEKNLLLFIKSHQSIFILIFSGFFLADICHVFLDKIHK